MDDATHRVILAKASEFASSVNLDSVGRPVEGSAARQVRSWLEAAEEFRKWGDWVEVSVLIANQLSNAYSDRFTDWYHSGYDQLNEGVAAIIRPACEGVISRIPPLFEREHLHRVYVNTGVFQALEAPLLGQGVHPMATNMARVLTQGHFLCGFDETGAAMRMVVY